MLVLNATRLNLLIKLQMLARWNLSRSVKFKGLDASAA